MSFLLSCKRKNKVFRKWKIFYWNVGQKNIEWYDHISFSMLILNYILHFTQSLSISEHSVKAENIIKIKITLML